MHLFLGTKTDNAADRHAKGRDARGERSGRKTKPFSTAGVDNGRAKLTPELVAEIKNRRASGMTLVALATAYGVGLSNISRIVRGRSWRWTNG